MSSWRPICLVWTSRPQWPSKARPHPVQPHPRSWTWEVSWPDSENIFPGLERDRCWWPLLFQGGPSSPGYQFLWLKFRQPSPNCEGIVGQTGSGRNPQRTNPRGATTHCIKVTPGKGSFHYGDWRTGAHRHGCRNAGGTNGALKWSDD